jgi:hypothetical protein
MAVVEMNAATATSRPGDSSAFSIVDSSNLDERADVL